MQTATRRAPAALSSKISLPEGCTLRGRVPSSCSGIIFTFRSGTFSSGLGRLNRFTWQEHFKITGNKKIVRPEVFADGATQTSTTWDLFDDSGKLGTIKNVTIRNVNENSMYADPDTQQSASWYFNEFKGNTIMIYNSPYSDFAAKILPQGKCNITGIIKRFNNTWEIIIRDENDVEEIN